MKKVENFIRNHFVSINLKIDGKIFTQRISDTDYSSATKIKKISVTYFKDCKRYQFKKF